jgi:hypothetical protein
MKPRQITLYHTPSQAFPVDASTIAVPNLRLHPSIGNCPVENLDKLPPVLRNAIVKITPGVLPSSSNFGNRYDGETPRYIPKILTRAVHVDSFGAITLNAKKDGHKWRFESVDFNPGRLLHGHNGWILSEDQFLKALSIYRHLVAPMLAEQDDVVHLIPGVPGSRSHWKKVEIPFHLIDTDGTILTAIENAKPESINSRPYRKEGETATFENSNKSLRISAYRKDIQMLSGRRNRSIAAAVDQPVPAILRVEVTLAKEKLTANLPCVTDDGEDKAKNRFVRVFRGSDLREAHMKIVREFKGAFVFHTGSANEKNDRIAAMMAWVAIRTGLSLTEQFEHFERRFLQSTSLENRRNNRSSKLVAARKELEVLRNIDVATLFSDEAWSAQPCVTASKLETMTAARHVGIDEVDPDIQEAYGSDIQPD